MLRSLALLCLLLSPASAAASPSAVVGSDRGRAVDFTPFDSAGRVTAIALARGVLDITYDATGAVQTATMPAAALGEARQALRWSHDGPLLTSVESSGLVSGTLVFGYDPNTWELTSERLDAHEAFTYAYDADGALILAGVASAPLTLSRHAGNGAIEGLDIGVVSTSATSDGLGRWSSWVTTWPGGLFGEELSYASNANRVRCQNEQDAAGTVRALRYVYDASEQLREVHADPGCTGTPSLMASYAYDANGNRTAWTDARGSFVGVYDDQDRLVRVEAPAGAALREYAYNTHGQLERRTDLSGASPAATDYAYDARGDLLRVALPSGRVVEYRVDALGRRVQRLVDGVVERGWLYRDGLRPLAELDASGAVRAHFVYASRAHAPDLMIVPGGATYRIVKDHLGSVRAVVDVATGAVAQALSYDAFGRVTSDTSPGFQPFGYAGGLYDPDTELVRFGARDYDADVGRWTAKDPILFGGGDNLYAYVGNDPVGLIDPTGLWLETAIDIASIGFDIYALYNDNIAGDCDNLGWNLLALGGDIAGLVLPFVAGVGVAIRAGRHADEAVAIATHADDVVDAARGLPNHFASFTVTSADGTNRIVGNAVSGPMVAEELALGAGNARAAVHTEARITRVVPLQPGDTLRIDGMLPPCTRCRGSLNVVTQNVPGTTATYTWYDDAGHLQTWTSRAGRRAR